MLAQHIPHGAPLRILFLLRYVCGKIYAQSSDTKIDTITRGRSISESPEIFWARLALASCGSTGAASWKQAKPTDHRISDRRVQSAACPSGLRHALSVKRISAAYFAGMADLSANGIREYANQI
jgi:hypothetical protein